MHCSGFGSRFLFSADIEERATEAKCDVRIREAENLEEFAEMRGASFIFGPCLLLLAVLLPLRAKYARGKTRVARRGPCARALLPEDQVLREKQTLAATKNMVLLWRDEVKTEKGGRVRIELADGSILNVGSEAQLRILKSDPQHQETTLELLYGRLLAGAIRIVKPSGKFRVRTPVRCSRRGGHADLRAASRFRVDRCGLQGGLRFLVNNRDENVVGEVLLHAGEFTRVERGKPPSPAAPASSERLRAGDDATSIPKPP